MKDAMRMAKSWRVDKLVAAEAEAPGELMIVHRAHCLSFILACTCEPVFVIPPARA